MQEPCFILEIRSPDAFLGRIKSIQPVSGQIASGETATTKSSGSTTSCWMRRTMRMKRMKNGNAESQSRLASKTCLTWPLCRIIRWRPSNFITTIGLLPGLRPRPRSQSSPAWGKPNSQRRRCLSQTKVMTLRKKGVSM